MSSYIYSITNKLNGQMYIGKTINPKKRFNDHCKYKSSLIGKAIRKHGRDNFVYQVLYDCPTEEQAYRVEVFYIRLLKTQTPFGYNLDSGGMGGKQPCEETKRKISQSLIGNKYTFGYKHTEETRKKMSEARKGKHLTEEHKRKLSESKKGENNPSYGKHPTEETRKKMSEARMGNKNCVGRIPWNKGKKRSEETKQKISKALKGRPGKRPSEETRRKLSEAKKRYWNKRKQVK